MTVGAATSADASTLRVACLQMALRPTLPEAEAGALALARDAGHAGAALALLPEYWFMPTKGDTRADPAGIGAWAGEALPRIARQAGIAVAGNHLERDATGLWNVLRVLDADGQVGAQRKVHPMPTEESWGVAGWHRLDAFPWRGTRLGGLVCADVLHPEAARLLALQGAEVVLNPVMSYAKPVDPTREARRAMFVARAYDNACFVLKAGSVGPAGKHTLVGRSLVAAPWGVVTEAKDEAAEEVVLADLDLTRLRDERRRSLSLPRRRPGAYAPLADVEVQRDLPASPAHDEPAFDVAG